MLREENGINSPFTPARRILKRYSKLYYYGNWQSPDFRYESGFSRLDGTIYRTYINGDLLEGKEIFTLAHELGHIVLGHHVLYDVDQLRDKEHILLNREADVFAAEFLMPEQWVRAYARPPITTAQIGKLKQLFGVSWLAMFKRLNELGIQTDVGKKASFEKVGVQ
jgi:Zn-dependent peptidase ImmA (M78 family)